MAKLNPPKQDRSERTLDRLVTAALELMEEEGIDSATVSRIARRARASVGSFYARFQSKEDFVAYLQERVWRDATEAWDAAMRAHDWTELPLDAVVEGVVALLARSLAADFRRRKALRGSTGPDDPGSLRRLEFHTHVLDSVSPLFLARVGDISHPDPHSAIGLAYRFAVGSIREVLEVQGAGEGLEGVDSTEVLVQEVARAWQAYLGYRTEEEGPGERREVDFFDPWG